MLLFIVVVSCRGYLTRKLVDQTVEIFIGIGDVTSTNGPGKCASTKTLNKYKILMFVVYMLTGV